ncbi:hypothetical protein EDD18DRAFT_1358053 [Armillaria luteobubalina]|uniref:Uncharacterized protein n=1 Tax=Armillaria luteobubalina TaxID=153913 RepID=A0AA39UL27_9AGAR|nr:hypothetical protein EDD18DRAFT_1358053 [Armillaria luteobubalina]
MAVYLAFHVLTLLGPPKAYIYIPHPSVPIATHSLSKRRLMSFNYYHNRRPQPWDAFVLGPNGHRTTSASIQSHRNTAQPTSHAPGAPHQEYRTTTVYPAFPPHAPVRTLANGGYAGGSQVSQRRASSRTAPSAAVVPYNPARNRANSNAPPRNDTPNHPGRNYSSAVVPNTRRPSAASNGQNSIPFHRMGTDPVHIRADAANFHFHYHHR